MAEAANCLVYVLFTNSGRNSGKFMGMAPTGKTVKWHDFVLFRFEDGKIAESRYVENLLYMFGQLGVHRLPG